MSVEEQIILYRIQQVSLNFEVIRHISAALCGPLSLERLHFAVSPNLHRHHLLVFGRVLRWLQGRLCHSFSAFATIRLRASRALVSWWSSRTFPVKLSRKKEGRANVRLERT